MISECHIQLLCEPVFPTTLTQLNVVTVLNVFRSWHGDQLQLISVIHSIVVVDLLPNCLWKYISVSLYTLCVCGLL